MDTGTYDLDKITARLLEMVGTLHKDIFKRSDDFKGSERKGQNAVLFILDKRGACLMSEVGKALGVTNPNVTFLVDKLEADGFVQRFQDPSDRRVTKLQITMAGREYIKEIRTRLMDRIKSRLAGLDEADIAALDEGLNKLSPVFMKMRREESQR